MEPDFVIVPQSDPREILWRHFPELKLEWAEDLDEGPYYLFSLFAEDLISSKGDPGLWQRAIPLFEELAAADSAAQDVFVVAIVEALLSDEGSTLLLRHAVGPKARLLLP